MPKYENNIVLTLFSCYTPQSDTLEIGILRDTFCRYTNTSSTKDFLKFSFYTISLSTIHFYDGERCSIHLYTETVSRASV